MARPTKYSKKYCEKARKLAEKGCTDKEIADILDVTEQTINNWKKSHKEFFESLKEGKSLPDKNVEQALYKRCIGYKCKEDKLFFDSETKQIISKRIIKHYPPDTTACIYWTKNRMPERWRDVRQTQLTGENGGPVKVQQMTDEQLSEEIAKAEAELAGVKKPGKGKKSK